MSKSSRRLETFREVVRRRKDKPTQPERWTWKDRLSVWGSLGVALLLVFIPLFDQYLSHHQQIKVRVEKWATDYRLNDEQVRRIIEIEKNFHSYELRHSTGPNPSPAAENLHLNEIASTMDEESSNRFLQRESSRLRRSNHGSSSLDSP